MRKLEKFEILPHKNSETYHLVCYSIFFIQNLLENFWPSVMIVFEYRWFYLPQCGFYPHPLGQRQIFWFFYNFTRILHKIPIGITWNSSIIIVEDSINGLLRKKLPDTVHKRIMQCYENQVRVFARPYSTAMIIYSNKPYAWY